MCPICEGNETIPQGIEPITTNCNHTFCKDCLLDWANIRLSNRRSITCPICIRKIGQDCVLKLNKINWGWFCENPAPPPPPIVKEEYIDNGGVPLSMG